MELQLVKPHAQYSDTNQTNKIKNKKKQFYQMCP